MWYGFFPGDRRRDGGKVERVRFVRALVKPAAEDKKGL